jgi:hypothetical protein
MTYACHAWEFAADTYILTLQCLQNEVLIPPENFQGAHHSAIYTWLSTFHMYTIIQQNWAGNKQKSYKIMKMNMFAAQDKAEPDIENIRGLTHCRLAI